MGVLAIFTGQSITKAMYDALRAEVGWERQHPQGAILHAASFDEAGSAHVADVWSSPEALDEFVNKRLIPAMQKLNVQPPQVEVYSLHNLNAFASIQQYMLK